ncbi:MAG: sulfotransferase [Nocardioides sp.]|nr:sulfotransferase [Nocardioides sp.]
MGDGHGRPIFVVGCHRSGTTLLRLILDSHPHISCGPETLFLTEFAERITGDGHWAHFALYGFPRNYWLRQIAAMFDRVQSDYAASRGKVRWADKTPRYALSVGLIAEMFPDCQIVHLIRDGRDVVASHQRTWGYLSGVKATAKWPYYIRAVQAVGRRLPPERYLEVRYEDLVADPKETVARLLEFLDEPWDDAVLHYDEHQHDVHSLYHDESARRRAESADGATIYRARAGTAGKGLDPLLRVLAGLLSRRTLRDLGYR